MRHTNKPLMLTEEVAAWFHYYVIKSKISLAILIATFHISTYEGLSQTLPEDISVTRIYSDDTYNAFTSPLKFKGRFYCAFRSGEAHVYGRDGIRKIISSKDGKKWKEIASLAVPGYDLRDPKLSITPNGTIMVTIGGSIYEGRNCLGLTPHVAFSNERGNKFTGLISFTRDGDFKNVLKLPSNSDFSYPGFVFENGMLYISYYSSHETEKTSIYFAEVLLSYFDSKK